MHSKCTVGRNTAHWEERGHFFHRWWWKEKSEDLLLKGLLNVVSTLCCALWELNQLTFKTLFPLARIDSQSIPTYPHPARTRPINPSDTYVTCSQYWGRPDLFNLCTVKWYMPSCPQHHLRHLLTKGNYKAYGRKRAQVGGAKSPASRRTYDDAVIHKTDILSNKTRNLAGF